MSGAGPAAPAAEDDALRVALHDLQGHVMSILYNARFLVEAGLVEEPLEAARDVLGAAEEMKALLLHIKTARENASAARLP